MFNNTERIFHMAVGVPGVMFQGFYNRYIFADSAKLSVNGIQVQGPTLHLQNLHKGKHVPIILFIK